MHPPLAYDPPLSGPPEHVSSCAHVPAQMATGFADGVGQSL
jgi:hypothetical protein